MRFWFRVQFRVEFRVEFKVQFRAQFRVYFRVWFWFRVNLVEVWFRVWENYNSRSSGFAFEASQVPHVDDSATGFLSRGFFE